MTIDWNLALAGLCVGSVIGLTGMGGGALMTPVLVLVFGVPPSVAVSSDLMASLLMKPVGAAVHLKKGTVHLRTAGYLVIGSVPAAFLGAAAFYQINGAFAADLWLRMLLGVTLLIAAAAMSTKMALARRRGVPGASQAPLHVHPGRTIAVGVVGGVIVGLTSVGSGSLILVLLMLLHPRLSAARLVGTDLVQAIPLVGSAALGHLLFGEIHFDIMTSLLVGSLPGVYVGARLSAKAPDAWIRPALLLVLTASALKLLGLGTGWITLVSAALAVVLFAGVLARKREAGAAAPLTSESDYSSSVVRDAGGEKELAFPPSPSGLRGSEGA